MNKPGDMVNVVGKQAGDTIKLQPAEPRSSSTAPRTVCCQVSLPGCTDTG